MLAPKGKSPQDHSEGLRFGNGQRAGVQGNEKPRRKPASGDRLFPS